MISQNVSNHRIVIWLICWLQNCHMNICDLNEETITLLSFELTFIFVWIFCFPKKTTSVLNFCSLLVFLFFFANLCKVDLQNPCDCIVLIQTKAGVIVWFILRFLSLVSEKSLNHKKARSLFCICCQSVNWCVFFCIQQPQWHWNEEKSVKKRERKTYYGVSVRLCERRCLQPPVDFVFKREWLIRCDFSIVPHVQSSTRCAFKVSSLDICRRMYTPKKTSHSNACTTFQLKYRFHNHNRKGKAAAIARITATASTTATTTKKPAINYVTVWKNEWKKKSIELRWPWERILYKWVVCVVVHRQSFLVPFNHKENNKEIRAKKMKNTFVRKCNKNQLLC